MKYLYLLLSGLSAFALCFCLSESDQPWLTFAASAAAVVCSWSLYQWLQRRLPPWRELFKSPPTD
jgi:predicted PurR-regulated permease PerM